jgi:hypothetical protein
MGSVGYHPDNASQIERSRRLINKKQEVKFLNNKKNPSVQAQLLKAALINSRSIVNKTAVIHDLLVSDDLDCLLITETWLTGNDILDKTILAEICSRDYSALSWPRKGKKGGGLAFIHKNGLPVKQMQSKNECKVESFELSTVRMCFSSKSITIAIIYRPPSSSIALFSDEFTNLCTHLLRLDEVIICGDFNLSIDNGSMLNEILTSFQLRNHVMTPTHDAGGTLDLILTWERSELVKGIRTSAGISDHLIILFELNPDSNCIYKSNQVSRKIRPSKP